MKKLLTLLLTLYAANVPASNVANKVVIPSQFYYVVSYITKGGKTDIKADCSTEVSCQNAVYAELLKAQGKGYITFTGSYHYKANDELIWFYNTGEKTSD